jgi:hypothetical protein
MRKKFAKFIAKGKGKENMFKPLDEALAKHGVTDEVLQQLEEDLKGKGVDPKDPDALTKIMKKVIAPVKDRRAFLADLMAAMEKLPGGMKKQDLGAAELKDLKVEDDRATGVLVSTEGGAEQRTAVVFRRQGGGWRMEMPQPKVGKGPF